MHDECFSVVPLCSIDDNFFKIVFWYKYKLIIKIQVSEMKGKFHSAFLITGISGDQKWMNK